MNGWLECAALVFMIDGIRMFGRQVDRLRTKGENIECSTRSAVNDYDRDDNGTFYLISIFCPFSVLSVLHYNIDSNVCDGPTHARTQRKDKPSSSDSVVREHAKRKPRKDGINFEYFAMTLNFITTKLHPHHGCTLRMGAQAFVPRI